MSPTMVDFRSPLQNPNPKTGQTTFPLLLNLTGSFNLSQQTKIPPQTQQHPPMNSYNGDSRNFDNNGNLRRTPFASPTPASESASSVPGLSRPRLVKVRRHFGSHRGKPLPSSLLSASPGSIKETHFDSGFNPSGSNAPISRGSDRTDNGNKMLVPENQVDLVFNPFRSSASVMEGSDKGNDVKLANTENRVELDFNNDKMPVKGSKVDLGFNPCRSSSSVLDGANQTDFGEIRVLSDRLHSWNPFSPQEVRGRGGSSGSNYEKFEFGKSGESGFVFGGNRMMGVQWALNSNSDSKDSLPDEMRKLKIGSVTESQNVNDAGCCFTAGGKATSNLNSGETSYKDVFVFGNSGKKSSSSGPNSVDASSASKFPDEMRRLKIGSGMASQDTKNTGFTFTAGRYESLSLNLNSGEVPDMGVFEFGSSMKKGSDSAPNLVDESSVSKLPDEMRKLKIQESRKDQVSEKSKGTDFSSKDDEKFGFVFGTGSKNLTGSFCEISETALPVEMKKLNIDSQIGDNDGTNTSFSSTPSAKDTPFQNPATRIFNDATVGTSIPSPFSFQVGMQGNISGVHPVLPTQLKGKDLRSSGVAGLSSSSSSTGPGFQSGSNVFEQLSASPTGGSHQNDEFSAKQEAFGTPHTDFITPKQDGSWSYRDSLFGGSHQNVEFSAKQGPLKEMKSKKRRGKLGRKNLIPAQKSSQESSELGSPGSYSPMDFSPYQETLKADQCSRETSVASGESISLESTDTHEVVPMDARDVEDLASEKSLNAEDLASENDKAYTKNDSNIAAVGTEAGIFGSSIERASSDGGMFYFASGSEDVSETNFTFAARTSSQGPLSAAKRHSRKKNWMKVTQDSYVSTPNAKVQSSSPSVQFMPLASSSLQQGLSQGQLFAGNFSQLEPGQGQKGDWFVSQNETLKETVVKKDHISTAAASTAAQEACEKWRQRGNQAYANSNLSKAEDYYTRGVNCVSPKETSRSCVRALMLCYSNRAATRMSLGRMREALGDCMMAATIEPNFLRAQVRAANCYLALGETEDALKHLKRCLQTGCDVSLDQKITTEATDGLQKSQQLAEYMDRSSQLLQKRTYNDAANALELITKALSISPYSDYLVEMKAEALLMLQKYEEVVQLCEQTLESAERNSSSNSADGKSKDVDGSQSVNSSPVNLWRWYLISKSYFYLGRLEDALELLQKHEQVEPIREKYGSKVLESSVGFAVTVRDLLRHKAAGNEAFQAGRHAEAVEHYTAALQCNVESRPFAAICFANRAAAYQALGQITDAIADCSLAIALHSNYPKAISRRATLHEMIRDYGQAIYDLEKLVSLLDKQTDDKSSHTGTLGRSTSSANDLRQAQMRLTAMEEEAKKGIPLDMYLILGIDPSSSAVDIKKAYRKAALRHHPDKASQFLPRCENGDDGLWKEVADEVHKDFDRLFKMIGEAYAIISDSTKRLRYDAEEEMRIIQKKGNGSSTPKPPGDVPSYPFEKSSNRRQWRDPWKSYGNPHQRWSESSRSNRY